MTGSGSLPDGSSGPDDINDRLAEIAAELSAEAKFKEPSAAERARAVSPGRPGGGPLRGKPTPARRRGSARSVLSIALVLAVLGAVSYSLRAHWHSGTPETSASTAVSGHPRLGGSSTPSPTPLFTTASPFAGSPAADYANGAAGIVLPGAHPVGQFSRAQVAAAYATVKNMLIAAMLNRSAMDRRKPTALGKLLISQQRSWFYRHLTKPIRLRHKTAWLTRNWVTAFASGTDVVGSIVKVHGLPMTARVVTASQRTALQIKADYLFVYAVQQPGVAASRLRIVAQQYATVDFAPWTDPGGSLEPWIFDFGASYAGAQCGTTDGFVHPAFSSLGPGQVAPSGAPVNPYRLGPTRLQGCQAITGT